MSKACTLIEAAKKSHEYWAELAKLDFSMLLGEAMDEQKMTKTQLAKRADVSRAYISKVLGGDAVNFTLESMAKFMFALGQRIRFVAEPIVEKAPRTLEQLYDLTRAEQKRLRSPKVPYITVCGRDLVGDREESDSGQLYSPHRQEDSEYKEGLAA